MNEGVMMLFWILGFVLAAGLAYQIFEFANFEGQEVNETAGEVVKKIFVEERTFHTHHAGFRSYMMHRHHTPAQYLLSVRLSDGRTGEVSTKKALFDEFVEGESCKIRYQVGRWDTILRVTSVIRIV